MDGMVCALGAGANRRIDGGTRSRHDRVRHPGLRHVCHRCQWLQLLICSTAVSVSYPVVAYPFLRFPFLSLVREFQDEIIPRLKTKKPWSPPLFFCFCRDLAPETC